MRDERKTTDNRQGGPNIKYFIISFFDWISREGKGGGGGGGGGGIIFLSFFDREKSTFLVLDTLVLEDSFSFSCVLKSIFVSVF